MAELKPCPFCGGAAQWGEDTDGFSILFCATCSATFMSGHFGGAGKHKMPDHARDETEAAWNKRPAAPEGTMNFAEALIKLTEGHAVERPGTDWHLVMSANFRILSSNRVSGAIRSFQFDHEDLEADDWTVHF